MKILFMTASPVRDKHIDELIASELSSMGHEVHIKPCIREGRDSVIEIKPNVVVTPPIVNPFARDTIETCKYWGMGVVCRHTEASMDWQDWKDMGNEYRQEMLGRHPYFVDAEIVWGTDEAEIRNKRGVPFKAFPVGSFVVDVYKQDDFQDKFMNRENFNTMHGLRRKKTIMFASCWSFADSAPDLRVDQMAAYQAEKDARDEWIDAVNYVYEEMGYKWNVLLKVHPGEDDTVYKERLHKNVVVLKERSSPETLKNIDCLIHAGSTMAIEAHMVNIPAFQFHDVHKLVNTSWLTRESMMSKVSPNLKTAEDIVSKMVRMPKKSNANKEALDYLEKGRFGLMDGQAYKRAAQIISNIGGEFKLRWPRSYRDYSTRIIKRTARDLISQLRCNACGEIIFMPKTAAEKGGTICCPWCGAKNYTT